MDICRRTFGAYILAGLTGRALALPPRPKLLVLVVLEHIRPDYLDAIWGQIGTGGFRRVVEGGAYFPDCRHLASSFTATTLATLATGTWPAQHGIVADTWFDRANRKPVQASAEALRAGTLTSEIVASSDTRAFVVALDASQAGLAAGSSDAQTYWIDEEGRFATRGEIAAWINDYNQLNPLEKLHDAPWLAIGAPAGSPPLRILRFDAADPQEFLALYRASPFSQAATFDFARELATRERLGQGNTFDLLCVIVSSGAQLGYETGSRSPLMQQMTLHLDRQLESLLNQLDRTPGAGAYNLVIAGGHGAPPAPSPEERPRMVVNGELLALAIQRRLAETGNGKLERYLYPFLYLDTSGFLVPEAAHQFAGRAALQQPAVAAYYTAGGEASVRNEWERRFRNSFYPQRSGDVMLSYQAGYVEDTGAGRGISYGSLYNYDVQTLLCFYGPQFRAAVFEHPVESVDVAPTLARAIGVAAPSSSLGRVLGEAFAGTEDRSR